MHKLTMHTGDVSEQFHVTRQTVRNWVKNRLLNEFFSPEANGTPNKPAIFNERDFEVIMSINTLSKQDKSWQQIADTLRTGWRETQLPEGAAVVAAATTPSLHLATRAIVAEDRVKEAYTDLTAQNTLLIHMQTRLIELEKEKSEIIERLSHEREEAVGRVVKEKEELLREITRIEKERSSLETELRIRTEMKG